MRIPMRRLVLPCVCFALVAASTVRAEDATSGEDAQIPATVSALEEAQMKLADVQAQLEQIGVAENALREEFRGEFESARNLGKELEQTDEESAAMLRKIHEMEKELRELKLALQARMEKSPKYQQQKSRLDGLGAQVQKLREQKRGLEQSRGYLLRQIEMLKQQEPAAEAKAGAVQE